MAPSGSVGLISRADASVAVPLERVQVRAKLLDLAADIELCQHFANKEDAPIEALYRFPLSKQSALYGFEAIVDGVKLTGEIQEKGKAQDKYDDAIAEGKGAYLVQRENTEEEEVFSMLVGNLPPHKEVEVRVQYVCEVNVEFEQLRFVLPSTISPLTALQIGAPITTSPEASPAESGNPPTGDNNKLAISIDIEMPSDIVAITSPSHPGITVTPSPEKRTAAQVSLQQVSLHLDRDVVLLIKTAEPHKPRAWIERLQMATAQTQQEQMKKEGNVEDSHAIMLSYLPSFEKETAPCEIVFIVDRSGSMSGQRIQQACTALQFFLRSLPENCCFNIIGFGSSIDKLFPASEPYSDDTLDAASAKVGNMSADLGGTDLYQPLREVFSRSPEHGYRAVFVLTDGQVDNRSSVIQLVRQNADRNRVFSFGIGHDVDRELVNGIAKEGKGEAEFVIESEGNINVKVLRHLARALRPFISEISIDWGLVDKCSDVVLKQSPKQIPTVMDGERITVYALITGYFSQEKLESTANVQPKRSLFSRLFGNSSTAGAAPTSTMTGSATLTVKWVSRGAKETVSHFQIPLIAKEPSEGADHPPITNGVTVHRLAAKSIIKDLEKEGRAHRDTIIDLSCRFSVASKFTSFVAVEHAVRDPNAAITEQMMTRTVPIHMTTNSPLPSVQLQPLMDQPIRSSRFSASVGAAPMSAASAGGGAPKYKEMKKMKKKSAAPRRKHEIVEDEDKFDEFEDIAASKSVSGIDNEFTLQLAMECEEAVTSMLSFADSNFAPPSPPCAAPPPPPPPYVGPPSPAPVLACAAPPPPGGPPKPRPSAAMPASLCKAIESNDDEDNSSGSDAWEERERESCDKKDSAQKQQQQQQRRASPQATLNSLVMQQKASGCWKLDAAFAKLFSVPIKTLKQAMPQQLQQQVQDATKQESIWATALALAFLEGACKQFKGEWDMLAQKAQRWLEKELASASSVKDLCLNDAREALRQHGVM